MKKLEILKLGNFQGCATPLKQVIDTQPFRSIVVLDSDNKIRIFSQELDLLQTIEFSSQLPFTCQLSPHGYFAVVNEASKFIHYFDLKRYLSNPMRETLKFNLTSPLFTMDPNQTLEKIFLSVRREIYFVSKREDKFEISLKNLKDPSRPIRASIKVPHPSPGRPWTQHVGKTLLSGEMTVSSDFRYYFDASSSDFDGRYYPKSFYQKRGDSPSILDGIESDKEENKDDDEDDSSTVFEREPNENGQNVTELQLIHRACKVKFFSNPFVTCWVRCGLHDERNHRDYTNDYCLMFCENPDLFPPYEMDDMLGQEFSVNGEDIDDYTLFDGMPAVYSKTHNTITVFSRRRGKAQRMAALPVGTRQVIFLNEPRKVVLQTEDGVYSLMKLVTEKQMRMFSTCLALSLHQSHRIFPKEVLQLISEFLT